MAIVIGFVSEKGGVGKTTSVYHIGVALARFHNFRVLVLDADYQRGGITCRLFPEMLENFRVGEVNDVTLFDAYRALYTGAKELPTLSILKSGEKFDLVPADPRLNQVSADKMPNPRNLRESYKMSVRHLTLVKDAIAPVLESYDFVLVDSHPDLHDLEKAIICASDYIVSPVKLDQQSAVGVPSTVQAITEINRDLKMANELLDRQNPIESTKFMGAIGMMCREYRETLKYSEQVIFNRLRRTSKIFKAYITEGDGIRQAAESSNSVFDLNFYNAQKQSFQFRAVAEELISNAS